MGNCFALDFKDLNNRWDYEGIFYEINNKISCEVKKIKEIFDIIKDEIQPIEYENGSVELLSKITFSEGKIISKQKKTMMKQFRARPNDFIVSKINARQGAIGVLEEGRKDVGSTMHFRVLRVKNSSFNIRYLHLALRSEFCKKEFAFKTGGIGKGEISENNLLEVNVPYPSLQIQQQIVDNYYSKKNLIKELEEENIQKEQEIEDYLIKELGIEIEEQKNKKKCFSLDFEELNRWDLKSNQEKFIFKSKYEIENLKNLIEFRNNKLIIFNGFDNRDYVQRGINYLRVSNIRKDKLKTENLMKIDNNIQLSENYKITENEVLLTRKGSYGISLVADKDLEKNYTYSSEVIKISLNMKKINPFYFSYFNNSFTGFEQYKLKCGGAFMGSLDRETIFSFKIPLPPLEIQEKIVNHINLIRNQIEENSTKIEELKELAEIELEKAIVKGEVENG